MAKNKHAISVILNDKEYEELYRQKEYLGFSHYSDVIRNYIHTGVCFKIDYSAFFEIATQIAKIGTNINQIAKAVNETHSVTKFQVMSLQKDMKKIEDILTETVQSKAHVSKRLSEDYFRGGTHGNNEDYQD